MKKDLQTFLYHLRINAEVQVIEMVRIAIVSRAQQLIERLVDRLTVCVVSRVVCSMQCNVSQCKSGM